MARFIPSVYLGIPYSKVDKELSFRIASALTLHMINYGVHVFSPITYTHMLHVAFGGAANFEPWREMDLWQIGICDVFVIVKMQGWKESEGLIKEIDAANAMNKRVEYITIEGRGTEDAPRLLVKFPPCLRGALPQLNVFINLPKHIEKARVNSSITSLAFQETKHIHARAANEFSMATRINKLIYELAELQVALSHHMEGKASFADVISEIADVSVLIDAFILMNSAHEQLHAMYMFKMDRLAVRMMPPSERKADGNISSNPGIEEV